LKPEQTIFIPDYLYPDVCRLALSEGRDTVFCEVKVRFAYSLGKYRRCLQYKSRGKHAYHPEEKRLSSLNQDSSAASHKL
jgi:hypothetical protein